MTDLDPCLAGCDAALAEAELLLAILGANPATETDLAPVRLSISAMRREVDRLRGMKIVPPRTKTDPYWMNLAEGESPWPMRSSDGTNPA